MAPVTVQLGALAWVQQSTSMIYTDCQCRQHYRREQSTWAGRKGGQLHEREVSCGLSV